MFPSRCAFGLPAPTRLVPGAGVLAAALLGTALDVPGADGAVSFADLADRDLDAVVAKAASARKTVMLVITQPDWCPPCIHLDRDLLRNPDETELAELAADWVAVEVHGYDEDGEALLRRHGIKFPGTPTTLLIQLDADDEILREGTLLASVVGYPPDYVDQLRTATEGGSDPVAEAKATAERTNLPTDWMALARLYAYRGQGHQARKAYSEVMAMESHPDVPADSLATLRVEARWEYLTRVLQRVDKDHKRFHHLVRDFLDDHPEWEARPEYRYAKVWTELALGHIDETMPEIQDWYLRPGTYDELATFMYMSFRNPNPETLELAIAEGEKALDRFPEHEASLHAALGRLYRRLGQTRKAEASFRKAVELTDPDTARHVTYKAQLEYVEKL